MPTVRRIGPYRFFFYPSDRDEPPHVHVERDDKYAKFWLRPVRFHSSMGFKGNELHCIQRLVEENEELLLGGWNEYFGH